MRHWHFVLAALPVIALILLLLLSRITDKGACGKSGDDRSPHASRERVSTLPPLSHTSAGWPEENGRVFAPIETPPKSSPSDTIGNRLIATGNHEALAEYAVSIAVAGKRDEILELFAAIENAPPDDREILARGLQALHASDIGPDLLAFLVRNAEDSVVAVQARDALARIVAPEDIEQVSQAVPSSPEQELLRAHLIQALSQISNSASVDALMNLCALSEDPDISAAVARALGSIGTPEAVTALVVFIQDSGIEDLNDSLSQALASVANKDSRLLLQDEFVNATNPVIQYATAYALASLSNQASQTQAFSAAEHP